MCHNCTAVYPGTRGEPSIARPDPGGWPPPRRGAAVWGGRRGAAVPAAAADAEGLMYRGLWLRGARREGAAI